jgi:hypothetical protein
MLRDIMPGDSHALAERRSLAAHCEIARRLELDPKLLVAASARLEQSIAQGTTSQYYAERWRALLQGPLEILTASLKSPLEDAKALRQATPFSGVLTSQERWLLWKQVRAEFEAGTP